MATEIDQQSSSQTQTNPHEPPSSSEVTKKLEKMNISLSIWPPTQRTRDAVIKRLIETLSSPSILSNRYGSLSIDEASSTAKTIEDEAFLIANATAVSPSSDESNNNSNNEDDGIEILQIYSKEISKRMLESVKSKASAAAAAATTEEVNQEEGDLKKDGDDVKEEESVVGGGEEISASEIGSS